jgi:hypothetical protein
MVLNQMTQNQKIFQRQIFITNEHGSWVFLLSPLLIGIFAGQSWSLEAVILVMGALVGFLIRHPITIAVKVLSGRRSKADLRPAGWAILIYSLVGVLLVGGLILRGLSYLLILAVPGIFVFVWHLYLVYNRAERGQMGIEIVASGVLALAAPAGYWIGVGGLSELGWWLWGLTWFQSAASIVYVYLQLAQREQKQIPSVKDRFRLGWRAALYSSFNLLTAILLSTAGVIPTWIFTPYLLQWSETFRGIYNPALGVKPTKIGIRQLIISSLFTLLFILAWRI